MQVDQTLVDLELVAVPGLRTLTARLFKRYNVNTTLTKFIESTEAYSLTGGDLENLGRQTNRALNAEVLILRAVHKVTRDYPNTYQCSYFQPDKSKDSHFSKFVTLLLVSVIRILCSLAVTGAPVAS